MSRRYLIGSPDYPLVERIRDGISTHGLRWAVGYYMKNLPVRDARMLLKLAYLHGDKP